MTHEATYQVEKVIPSLYARWVWEVEIPNKPTEKDMEKAMLKLKDNITTFLSDHPTIEDIEICETPYESWGIGFEYLEVEP